MRVRNSGAMVVVTKTRKGRSGGPVKTLSRSNIKQATAKGTGNNVVKV